MGYVSSFPGEVDITLIKATRTNSFPETDSDIAPQKIWDITFWGPGLFSVRGPLLVRVMGLWGPYKWPKIYGELG